MSQCKKFSPNIFNKTKCSNCFRQEDEHSAEALECNRASRSVARSGYLFVAPDWDFSVPLNRTKRWQRRWFVLYDDGELNYSVDEHPDTVPQGSIDMSKVLEVTGAEQVTGHPHSLALTGPDRVTFVKAASREDARWWAELLAVFPRRHKRNATFPGGRASPSLPQLGRSASPQPPRPRHLSCTGASPRANFTTPPSKEQKQSPLAETSPPKSDWVSTSTLPIETTSRTDYAITSGSPPTRDKLRFDEKVRARRNWRSERLRDIATALTDRSPESSLALPAEGLLHLKKGWLWLKDLNGEWLHRWVVLCGPTLNVYKEQDEQSLPELTVELSSVTGYSEIATDTKYGFQIQWSGPTLTLSAVTASIRSNWMQALKKAAPNITLDSPITPATPRSVLLSSDDEYRTASEGGRRGSEDWGDLPPSPPLARTPLAKVKERARSRPKLPRCQSRHSTLDSVSTDELDSGSRDLDGVDLKNTINKQKAEIDDLQQQLSKAVSKVHSLEEEVNRLKKIEAESLTHEVKANELLQSLQQTERELNQKEMKYLRDQKDLQQKLADAEETIRHTEEHCDSLTRELQTKQACISSLQEELSQATENLAKECAGNQQLYNRLQNLEDRSFSKSKIHISSLTDLTNINLDVDLDTLNQDELLEHCLDLRGRFEKAVLEIRAIKRELRQSYAKYDALELKNLSLQRDLESVKYEAQTEHAQMVARIDHLTSKLASAEKQIRSKSKERRSLSLKGRESFSINKEVEDKVTELEAKILSLESGRLRRRYRKERSSGRSSPIDDRSLRRLRRKSLDSATASESMKILMRLSSLDSKVMNMTTSNESLANSTTSDLTSEASLLAAKEKLNDCLCQISLMKSGKNKRSPSPNSEQLNFLEHNLNDTCDILSHHVCGVTGPEAEVISSSADTVVKQLQSLLLEKLASLLEKRKMLRETNKLDLKMSLELIAEKMAYESVLIGRIQEALQSPVTSEPVCERLTNKEIKETVFLLQSLYGKLSGINSKQSPVCKTSAEYLSQVLVKYLIKMPGQASINLVQKRLPSLDLLLDQLKHINNLYNSYKSVKLPQLADCLAAETLSLASDETCRLQILNASAINQFNRVARETVNRELIESEINHVLLRAAQIYESNLSADNRYFFSFFASERAALELWSDSVENHLYAEINKTIQEITDQYQTSLKKLQRQNWRRRVEAERTYSSSDKMLNEFADIVAHKALINARISVLSGECHQLSFSDENEPVKLASLEIEKYRDFLDDSLPVQVNQSLDMEFKFLFNKYSRECLSIVNQPELEKLLECFRIICLEICELKKCVNLYWSGVDDDVSYIVSWEEMCQKCTWIINQLQQIRKIFCTEVQAAQKNWNCGDNRGSISLGTEYLKQVENLRTAYKRALAKCQDTHTQTDIEQLQMLCERVLLTMEHWHHRTLQDTRETHSRELQSLNQEKEQALAEETQATLAALDAMRKAHEAEVQREVTRFKQEFVRQQRNEIMDLSERLSVKCLEAAALEEQLSSATRQLAHAQQHILQLEQNPQLSSLQN